MSGSAEPQEPMPRGTSVRVEHPETVDLHALASVPGTPLPRLTDDLHGGRQTAPYSPEFEPDIVLQRTNAIQAASYSLICDTTK